MKVTPKLLVARVEVAKVAQLIVLSSKCGTNYTLCNGLARVWVKSDKIVPKIRLSPKFDACADGNSENGAGIYSPRTTKNAICHVSSLTCLCVVSNMHSPAHENVRDYLYFTFYSLRS